MYASPGLDEFILPRYVCGALWCKMAWWRHPIETFSASLAICAGNSPITGEFPSQRPETRSFDFSLICVWINAWVNNRGAGDLRRHRTHYDVIVLYEIGLPILSSTFLNVAHDSDFTRASGRLAFSKRNSSVTGGFASQKASDAERVSMFWRHHVIKRVW